jgi:hypothetical protein
VERKRSTGGGGRPIRMRRSRRKGWQSYTLCEREWRTVAAARHDGPASNCTGMPDMFLQCICVSRGSSTREQEDLEVRERIGIANQSGTIISSHGSRCPAALTLHRLSEQDHDTSRKLVNPLIEPLWIPSLKHRYRGKADYRRHGSP